MKLNGIRKYINGFFWGLVFQKNKSKKNLLKIHFLIPPTFRSGLKFYKNKYMSLLRKSQKTISQVLNSLKINRFF